MEANLSLSTLMYRKNRRVQGLRNQSTFERRTLGMVGRKTHRDPEGEWLEGGGQKGRERRGRGARSTAEDDVRSTGCSRD